MKADSFSELLRRKSERIWEKVFSHPFIVEMRDGTLSLDKFRFYATQDYPYLIEFARSFGLAAAKADDIETMRTFSSLLNACVTIEVGLLENLGQKLGISVEELRASEASPSNLAYTHHLLHVGYSGTLGELLAAMLPCIWSYQEIGERIGDSVPLKRHPIYSEWCSAYRSEEYAGLVRLCRGIVDDFAAESSQSLRKRMISHYVLSARYEYMFWDMAYGGEKWPV